MVFKYNNKQTISINYLRPLALFLTLNLKYQELGRSSSFCILHLHLRHHEQVMHRFHLELPLTYKKGEQTYIYNP